VKASHQIEYLAGCGQRQAFTPPVILFIALPEAEGKTDAGVTAIPLQLLPRWCPVCGNQTIVGHGRRRKQAHDHQRDWIWIRRGRCVRCRTTFTILPGWLFPYCHYSIDCRQQAWDEVRTNDAGWEQSAPHCKDHGRLPDPRTLRRWAWHRLVSVWYGLKVWMFSLTTWKFLQPPTILAWDLPAASRILLPKASSP
jgi:hypothetical protein